MRGIHGYPYRGFQGPWMHHVAPAGSDHLLNGFVAAGAVATVLAFIVGLLVAIGYRHKATVTVSGELFVTDDVAVIAVRPSVNAVGPIKLRFADHDGAVVTVTPTLATESGTKSDHDATKKRDAFPPDEMENSQFISPGETLTSSLLVRVDPTTPNLLGWWVALNVASKGIVRHGLHWADRVFVPVKSLATR